MPPLQRVQHWGLWLLPLLVLRLLLKSKAGELSSGPACVCRSPKAIANFINMVGGYLLHSDVAKQS